MSLQRIRPKNGHSTSCPSNLPFVPPPLPERIASPLVYQGRTLYRVGFIVSTYRLLALLLCVLGWSAAKAALADIVLTCDRPGHVLSTAEGGTLFVSGAEENALITLRWENSAGRTLAETHHHVSGGVIVLGKRAPGWYHVRASRDGDAGEATIDIAFARPRSATPFDDNSPFGMVGVPPDEADWPLFEAMGVKWTQFSIPWSYAERQPGRFWHLVGDPYGHERAVLRAASRGIRVVLQFRESPLWANAGQIGSYVGAEPRTVRHPVDDDHAEAFERFEAEVIGRYLPLGIRHYENWSEGTGSLFLGDNSPNFPKIEAYRKMLLRLRGLIDSRGFDARVVSDGGITAGRILKSAEEGYTEPEMYQNGVGAWLPSPYAGMTLPGIGNQVVDIVSGHFYWVNWQTREYYAPEAPNYYPIYKGKTLFEAAAATRAWAGVRPIWNSEFGYGSADSWETKAPMFVSEEQQANYLVRFYLVAAAAGIEKSFYYRWRDYVNGERLETSYGLLRPDGVVKPSYIAYRTMTERLAGLRFEALLEQGPVYWAARFGGPRSVIAVWKVTEGVGTHAVAIPWEAARATGRDGAETVLGRHNGKATVTLEGGAPVFLDRAAPPKITGLSLTPSAVFGGSASLGTVTLSEPAPSGGIDVAVGCSDPIADTADSVTVPAGKTTATFPITTRDVSEEQTTTVWAELGESGRTASLRIYPPAPRTLKFTPNPVYGGNGASATLTLTSPAPAGGLVVDLTSQDALLAKTPPSVTVNAGKMTAAFAVQTFATALPQMAVITATANGRRIDFGLRVNPAVPHGIVYAPNPVQGGKSVTATLTLNGIAPAGGVTVALTALTPETATGPPSVTVPAGQKSAVFVATTKPVTSGRLAVFQATANGVSIGIGFWVYP